MIPHPCSDNAVCAKVYKVTVFPAGIDCNPRKKKDCFFYPSHFDSDSASTPSLGRRRSDARNPGPATMLLRYRQWPVLRGLRVPLCFFVA